MHEELVKYLQETYYSDMEVSKVRDAVMSSRDTYDMALKTIHQDKYSDIGWDDFSRGYQDRFGGYEQAPVQNEPEVVPQSKEVPVPNLTTIQRPPEGVTQMDRDRVAIEGLNNPVEEFSFEGNQQSISQPRQTVQEFTGDEVPLSVPSEQEQLTPISNMVLPEAIATSDELAPVVPDQVSIETGETPVSDDLRLFSDKYDSDLMNRFRDGGLGNVSGGLSEASKKLNHNRFYDKESFLSKSISQASLNQYFNDLSFQMFGKRSTETSEEEKKLVINKFFSRYIYEKDLEQYFKDNNIDMDMSRLRNAANSVAKGALSTTGHSFRGQEVLTGAIPDEVKDAASSVSPIAFALASTEELSGEIADKLLSVGEDINTNPRYRGEFFADVLPQGVGSLAPFLAGGYSAGALSGGSAAVGQVSSGVLGGLSNAGAQYDDAISNGADESTAITAAAIGFGVGTSEAFALGKLLPGFNRPGTGGSSKMLLSRMLDGATREGSQEAFVEIMNNVSAYHLYDPTRQYIDDAVVEATKAGAFIGLGLPFLGAGSKRAIKAAKTQAEKVLFADLDREIAEAIGKIDEANAARSLPDLETQVDLFFDSAKASQVEQGTNEVTEETKTKEQLTEEGYREVIIDTGAYLGSPGESTSSYFIGPEGDVVRADGSAVNKRISSFVKSEIESGAISVEEISEPTTEEDTQAGQELQQEVQPEVQPEAEPEILPEARTEIQPDIAEETQPEVQPETTGETVAPDATQTEAIDSGDFQSASESEIVRYPDTDRGRDFRFETDSNGDPVRAILEDKRRRRYMAPNEDGDIVELKRNDDGTYTEVGPAPNIVKNAFKGIRSRANRSSRSTSATPMAEAISQIRDAFGADVDSDGNPIEGSEILSIDDEGNMSVAEDILADEDMLLRIAKEVESVIDGMINSSKFTDSREGAFAESVKRQLDDFLYGEPTTEEDVDNQEVADISQTEQQETQDTSPVRPAKYNNSIRDLKTSDITEEQIDALISGAESGVVSDVADSFIDDPRFRIDQTTKSGKKIEGNRFAIKGNKLVSDYVKVRNKSNRKVEDNRNKVKVAREIARDAGDILRKAQSADSKSARSRFKRKGLRNVVDVAFSSIGLETSPSGVIQSFMNGLKFNPEMFREYQSVLSDVLALNTITQENAEIFGFKTKNELAEAIASQIALNPDGRVSKSGSFTKKGEGHVIEHYATEVFSDIKADAEAEMRAQNEQDGDDSDVDIDLDTRDSVLFMRRKFYADAGIGGTPTGHRVPFAPIEGFSPEKISKILRKLKKGLSMNIRFGRPKGGNKVYGSYSTTGRSARVKHSGNLHTTGHEAAHGIDDRYGIVPEIMTDTAALDQLMLFNDTFGSLPTIVNGAPVTPLLSAQEGFAEWLTAFILNPDFARSSAPDVMRIVSDKMSAKDMQALEDFSQDIRVFMGSSRLTMTSANVQDIGGVAPKPEKLGIFDWRDAVNVRMFDAMGNSFKSFYMAAQAKSKTLLPSEDYKVLARNFLGFNRKYDAMLNHGMLDGEGNFLRSSDGQRMTIEWLLSPMDNTDATSMKEDMTFISAAMISQRVKELSRRDGWSKKEAISGAGAGLFTDVSVAEEALNELDRIRESDPDKYARFVEASKRYREFADGMLKYMVKNGRLSQDDYTNISEKNLQYVAMNRIFESEPDVADEMAAGDPFQLAGAVNPVKGVKGSSKKIENPYAPLIRNLYRIYKETDRNTVVSTYVDMLTFERDMYDPNEVGELEQLVEDVTVISPTGKPTAPAGEKNVMPVWKDGELKYYRFHSEIFDGIENMYSLKNSPASFLTLHAKVVRWTVTHSPPFLGRNFARDTQHRIGGATLNQSGFGDFFGSEEDWANYKLYGGAQAGYYMRNAVDYNRALDRQIRDMAGSDITSIVNDPAGWGKYKLGKFKDGFNYVFEQSENVNRVAEYRAAYKKAIKKGYSDYDAKLYAAYQARSLLDFAVGGTWMMYINKIIPFSNAGVRGLIRSGHAITESAKAFKSKTGVPLPASFLARWGMYVAAPKLLLRMLVGMAGERDEKTGLTDKEVEYRQLPAWQKDLFYNIPTENGWITIPSPFEYGVMAAGVERIAEHFVIDDEGHDAFEGYTGINGSLALSMLPVSRSEALSFFMGPETEAFLANKDFYFGKHIVPPNELNMDMRARNTERASVLGRGAANFFNFTGGKVDPRQIDHIVRGHFTWFGEMGMKLSDLTDEDKGSGIDYTSTGFFKKSPGYSAKDVRWVMDYADKYGMNGSREMRALNDLVGFYFDARDTPLEKKYLNNLRSYATSLRGFWSSSDIGEKKITQSVAKKKAKSSRKRTK